jgi:hypothetical protein
VDKRVVTSLSGPERVHIKERPVWHPLGFLSSTATAPVPALFSCPHDRRSSNTATHL